MFVNESLSMFIRPTELMTFSSMFIMMLEQVNVVSITCFKSLHIVHCHSLFTFNDLHVCASNSILARLLKVSSSSPSSWKLM